MVEHSMFTCTRMMLFLSRLRMKVSEVTEPIQQVVAAERIWEVVWT